MTIFKLGELFCGPGGIGWGATHAEIPGGEYKIEHVWANDYDEDTCNTYRNNICPNDRSSVVHCDVRKLDLSFLRKNIGIVSQETYLFNGTIRENLLYAKPGATEEELINACKQANIYEFIEKQELGLDTVVGNRGLKLSGGEKQRISIARVLLKDPVLMIFDEATSALDSISEQKIQDAIEPLITSRTSILIAHRLSTILAADEILVIKDGKIAERGSHSKLVNAGGVYTQLYETQFSKAAGSDPVSFEYTEGED